MDHLVSSAISAPAAHAAHSRCLAVLHAADAGRLPRGYGLGKSKAKLLTEAHGRVTFEDVAGVDEAKQDLEEIVEFLRDPRSSSVSAARFRAVYCLSDLRVQVRRFWRVRLPVKPMFPSSPFPVRTSLKCSLASVQAAFVTCSSRPRRTHLALSSSTKSMLSVVTVARVSAVAMMSASRH